MIRQSGYRFAVQITRHEPRAGSLQCEAILLQEFSGHNGRRITIACARDRAAMLEGKLQEGWRLL